MPVNPWTLSSFLLLSSALVFLFPFAASALNQQGQALLSWRRSLGGFPEGLNSWDSTNETPCGWFGITCDPSNEVVSLELSYVDLFGKLPSNFTSLFSLKKLVLSGTNLTGSIPKEIGTALPQLTHLDLSENALTGEIPSELCILTTLEELHLNSNQLEGSIPIEIGNLTSLKWLLLYDNQLSGSVPSTIGRLRYLEVIRAGGNKNLEGSLPRQIPPELGDCTGLQDIYLYENSLTGSIPKTFGQLQNLKNLLLWQNNLVGIIPPELGNCNQMLVIDISMNSLTGSIPQSFGNLTELQEFQLSLNQVSGEIPAQLGKCQKLTHIELDNNQISGSIPPEIGNLSNLTLFYLWQNRLEGNIPPSISNCQNLEAMDLSQNGLVGPIPKGVFQLKKLNKLLLLSNNLSGEIPPEIGNCSSLIRFRANNNKVAGTIPPQIGNLKNLNFLDLGSNRIAGNIPEGISGCQNLTFLDLHSNAISGNLPQSLNKLVSLQFVDFSDNLIEGTLSASLGSLGSLTKLILSKNKLSGSIPNQLGSCSKLQLLDLSGNQLSGNIPSSIGKIPSLEIALNLSLNQLNGEIPSEFTGLTKLAILDFSYNHLSGDLQHLAALPNLVVLNVSHNNFSGHVPDTPFFSKLPLSVLTGNPALCFSDNQCDDDDKRVKRVTAARVAMVVLLCTACALLLAALYIILGSKKHCRGAHECDGDDDLEMSPPWEVTLYQKLDLSIADVARSLTAGNVIGQGRSGVVYKVAIPSGLMVAVKRFNSAEKISAASFSSEIATLATIRHRNIVRLLGWGANLRTNLLFYDYMANGTLGALLHEGDGAGLVEWETRFKIALGVAEGLAYLHHDCVPPILHRDVKSHNILLGDRYEAFLADFGLARVVEDEHGSLSANPQFAGSYGYIAPGVAARQFFDYVRSHFGISDDGDLKQDLEMGSHSNLSSMASTAEYACMLRITEKSDVYSYGVVLLEIITGKKPVDPSFPDGQHVVQWVRDHLKSKKDPVEILDPKLQGHPDTQIQEMLQALGISLLCTSNRAEDRPTMKDVAVLLREIRQEPIGGSDPHKPTSKSSKMTETNPSYSSSSVTPAQMLMLQQGSSRCSLAYSSSSASIPSSATQ
ncbi:hypothetical protein DKX38_022765 [Salix brachista]|uniref:non-specific serine/threonine protein kinase n=1 Tax=Salix brachista TaxID=2182728 RepID=A0A5N5K261_9ROSI|nr:hypothetical protein DKX38_022765 [Salix brachista]